MASFDPFGIKEDSTPAAGEPGGGEGRNLKPARTFLGTLLALSAAVALVCAAGLAARIHFLARTQQQPTQAIASPPKAPPKPAQAPQPKEAAPAAQPQAQAPKEKPAESPAKAPAPPPAPAAPAAPKPAPRAPAAAPPKEAAKPASTKKVEFAHSDPKAKQVFLLGPFLVRSKGRMAMTHFSGGEWRLTVTLIGGTTYQYRVETVNAAGRRRITKKQYIYVGP